MQARYNRHKAYFRMKHTLLDLNEYRVPSSLQQESQTHISFAFERFKRALCLGMPFTRLQNLTDDWSYVDYFICQRISDAFRLLATLLLCFDFKYLTKPESVENELLVNDDHVTQRIVFPSHKRLLNLLGKDNYENQDRKELANKLNSVTGILKQIDKIALCSLHDLNR
jgi:hypothetical protein